MRRPLCHIYFLLLFTVCRLTTAFAEPPAGLTQPVPDALVRVPPGQTAVLVEKQTQTLFVYEAANHENMDVDESRLPQVSLIFKADCSTGQAAGPKERQGDKKTPEGVYFLLDEYEDKYLTPVYGTKAFPTDYPNFMDRCRGKTGSAIWIHGTDRELKPMDSNGCIALENKNVSALANYIVLNSTALIIDRQLTLTDQITQWTLKNRVDALFQQWQDALRRGGQKDYLSLYDTACAEETAWWVDWLETRSRADHVGIGFKETGIYKQGDMIVVLADLVMEIDGNRSFVGKKKFFIRNGAAPWKIAGEVYQQKASGYADSDHPMVEAARRLCGLRHGREGAMHTVKDWLAAWSARDMDRFARFYAPGFRANGFSRSQWVNRKRQVADKSEYIRVTADNFEIFPSEKGIEVRFDQQYESDQFSSRGTKFLTLVNKDGTWKISHENWKKK